MPSWDGVIESKLLSSSSSHSFMRAEKKKGKIITSAVFILEAFNVFLFHKPTYLFPPLPRSLHFHRCCPIARMTMSLNQNQNPSPTLPLPSFLLFFRPSPCFSWGSSPALVPCRHGDSRAYSAGQPWFQLRAIGCPLQLPPPSRQARPPQSSAGWGAAWRAVPEVEAVVPAGSGWTLPEPDWSWTVGLGRWRAQCDWRRAARRPASAGDRVLEYSTKRAARGWSEPEAVAHPETGGVWLSHGGDAGGWYGKGYGKHAPQWWGPQFGKSLLILSGMTEEIFTVMWLWSQDPVLLSNCQKRKTINEHIKSIKTCKEDLRICSLRQHCEPPQKVSIQHFTCCSSS